MTLSPSELRDLSDRFFAAMNARDFDSAAALYSEEAIYELPALGEACRLTGRAEIIGYFRDAMAGDSGFRLSVASSSRESTWC